MSNVVGVVAANARAAHIKTTASEMCLIAAMIAKGTSVSTREGVVRLCDDVGVAAPGELGGAGQSQRARRNGIGFAQHRVQTRGPLRDIANRSEDRGVGADLA